MKLRNGERGVLLLEIKTKKTQSVQKCIFVEIVEGCELTELLLIDLRVIEVQHHWHFPVAK